MMVNKLNTISKNNSMLNIEPAQMGIFIFWSFRAAANILNILNLPFMNIINKFHIVGIVYMIIMAYITIEAIPKIKKPVWILGYILLAAFLASSFAADNFPYIKKIITGDFVMETIPLIAIVSMESDAEKLLKWMKFSAYFVLINSLIIPWTAMYISEQYSYMSLAYISIVPWSVMCYFSFKNRKLIDIVFTAITGINFCIFGSRGAILCMVTFILVYILIFLESDKKYFRIISLIFVSTLIIVNFNYIISQFANIVSAFNLHSRTLQKLIEKTEFNSSGRNLIYKNLIAALAKNPFGYGIGSDRVLSGGTGDYAHNMFLELFMDFGVVLGGIIGFAIIGIYIYMLYKCENENYKALFCVFAVPGFVMLMMSGSIYENYHIFVAVTIFINLVYKEGVL